MTPGSIGTDLRRQPWAYPGSACSEAQLLGVPAGGTGRCWAALTVAPAGSPGAATVTIDGAGRPLDDVLGAHGVAPVGRRRPVAAYGSNADPAVLHAKFTAAGVSGVVPLRIGSVRNARLATSAHVSVPGYLPAAAAAAGGRTLAVVVAWLDDAQVHCLDATEPNYRPVELDGTRHPVVMGDDGSRPSGVVVYDTRRDVLPFDPPAGGQPALWRHLLGALPDLARLLATAPTADDDSIRRLLHRLALSPALRDRAAALMGPIAQPSGLAGAVRPAPDRSGSPNLAG